MKKLACVLFVILIIGLAITFANNIIGIHIFSGDWVVGPVIVGVCFIIATIMLIYHIIKNV